MHARRGILVVQVILTKHSILREITMLAVPGTRRLRIGAADYVSLILTSADGDKMPGLQIPQPLAVLLFVTRNGLKLV
jgi:hypothetical protein